MQTPNPAQKPPPIQIPTSSLSSLIQIILLFHNNVLKTRVRQAGHLPMVSIVSYTQRDNSKRLHSPKARLPRANKLFITSSNNLPQVRFSPDSSQTIVKKSWLAKPGVPGWDSNNIFILQRPIFHSTSRAEFVCIT